MNNIIIISPVRSGSTWLNLALANHLKLYNFGETFCTISPELSFEGFLNEYRFFHSDHFNKVVRDHWSMRKLSSETITKSISEKQPYIIKITPWDLYDAKETNESDITNFDFFDLYKKTKPTIIFLYRKNLVEHFLSFNAVHQTGIMNADSPFMNYQRPKFKYTEKEFQYWQAHKEHWEMCYRDYGDLFDHIITYEELFNLDELCGVPLKQYHENFTLKLNNYTKEEKEECKQKTGIKDNYELFDCISS
jgi:hypothetical protein